jgi:tetratricopeptide (TPR) repeat protein
MEKAPTTSVEPHDLEHLYTPAMLAEMLSVSVRQIRHWQRAGLLKPTATVMQIPHFGFEEIATARLLAQWKQKGASVHSIQRQLSLLRESLGVDVDLKSLPVVAVGKRLLLRHGETILEASGQLHFSFTSASDEEESPATLNFEQAVAQRRPARAIQPEYASLEQMIEEALQAEDADDCEAAIEWYRSALAAHGPNPDICFQLAELLYRQGDVTAARERYFMALELDPELVEAQANLGCVLAECGQVDLAIAAFEGALKHYEEFADVHFHLARALDEIGQPTRAAEHWKRFLELAPASPWADEATERLNQSNLTWFDF